MAYVETVGLIVSLFCLPLLGFLLGKRFTAARLTDERDRQAELQDIHTLIENNRNDVGVQVQSIYDEIKQHADNNSREGNEVWNKLDEVWNKLQKVDKNPTDAASTPYQTITTT
jgi:vacuolar-type H+-ATPase subunit D/Vma8